ncbi:MAG: hypothetical protein KatS3mg132_751 [Limisphaera sp.]|nr:MAG: hypothetical protein KatS3mg132_751 [Limisphaera sp.]
MFFENSAAGEAFLQGSEGVSSVSTPCIETSGRGGSIRLGARQAGEQQPRRRIACVGEGFDPRLPALAPKFEGFRQPFLPFRGIRIVQVAGLLSQPLFWIGKAADVIMDFEHPLAQPAHVGGESVGEHRAKLVGFPALFTQDRFQHFIEHLVLEQPGLPFLQDGQARVQVQFGEVFSNEAVTETVQGADGRRVQEGQLFVPEGRILLPGGFLQAVSDSFPQLGRSRFRERDHQQISHSRGSRCPLVRGAVGQQQAQNPFHEGARLAGAGPGHHQDIARGCDGLLLGRGQPGRSRSRGIL